MDQSRLMLYMRNPELLSDRTIDELMPAMLSDKKRSGAAVNVVVPERIGKCVLRPMARDELRAFMGSGLKP